MQRTSSRKQPASARKPPSSPVPGSLASTGAVVTGHAARCACGGGCPRCRRRGAQAAASPIVAGLEVGRVDDPLERDADRIADVLHNTRALPRLGAGASVVRAPNAPRRLRGTGLPLPDDLRRGLETRFGLDLRHVRVHVDASAAAAARALGARAFALGTDIVFAEGRYRPNDGAGRQLLLHELAHVLQQSLRPPGAVAPASGATTGAPATVVPPGARLLARLDGARGAVARRAPDPVLVEGEEAEASIYDDVPDDETLDKGVDAKAFEKNADWWTLLRLVDVIPLRDRDPFMHPKAFANRTFRAQALMAKHGPKSVEGAPMKADGILGPRTYLGLLQVARDTANKARDEIAGLGFDLEAIAAGNDTEARARAEAIKPAFLVQAPLEVKGPVAVRYYEQDYKLALQDRLGLDLLLFNDKPPEGLRREDYMELLRRFYAGAEQKLAGTTTMARMKRDFVHARDFERAVQRDPAKPADDSLFFEFMAIDVNKLEVLQELFGVRDVLQAAYKKLPKKEAEAVDEAVPILESQKGGGPIVVVGDEMVVVLVAIYLAKPDEERRASVVSAYLAEKAEREKAEREAMEEHNRAVVTQWTDQLLSLLDRTAVNDKGEKLNNLELLGMYLTYLAHYLRQKESFDLVLDELQVRGANNVTRLFDDVEALKNNKAHSYLTELALSGRYRSDARVRQSVAMLGDRLGEYKKHGYETTGKGAVLLGGTQRVEVGQIAGEVSSLYLRDEDRERLKVIPEQRFKEELGNQGRIYVDKLLRGEEKERTQEDAALHIVQLAWNAANIDMDKDIEDVEWQQSVRVCGVRDGPVGADGVPTHEVNWEVVTRIVGDGWQTTWEAERPAAWGTASAFEYETFWLANSQISDIVQTVAIVVMVAAIALVAWEVGALALLASAAGGAAQASIAIILSLAFYHFTHERHSIEGYLVAAVEGYLVAVGFRLFAPVGAAAGRLILPATLEQVAFRRVIAAWLVRHGVTGGLVGVTTGPAGLLVEDLVGMAVKGTGFSPFEAYLVRAGTGLVFGAVFEIGGSVLLAPLFRAADRTVLSKIADVIKLVRTEKKIPLSTWLSESAGSLSRFGKWAAQTMEEANAKAVYEAAKKRFAEGTQQMWQGAKEGMKVTLQREVLELGGATLTDDAVKGLERLLRLGRGTLDDDAMATLLQKVRQKPERVEPWLKLLAGADDAVASGLITRGQLQALADAEATLALVARRPAGEVTSLLTSRFDNAIPALEAFAKRVNALDLETSDALLALLRTRGTAVTPASLLRLAESKAGLGDEVTGGLQRALENLNGPRLHGVLEALPDDQVGPFLRNVRTASADDLKTLGGLIDTHEAAAVAWAARLTIAESKELLDVLSKKVIAAVGPDVSASAALASRRALGTAGATIDDDAMTAILRATKSASPADLTTLGKLATDFDGKTVAWALDLPMAQADTLLRALSLEARATMVKDVSAAEAKAMTDALGLALVDKALKDGATAGLGARHIRSLRTQLHDASVADMLTSAAGAPGRLRGLIGKAENIEAAAKRLVPGAALGSDSIVLDSNVVFAIEALIRGTPFASLTPNRKIAIEALRKQLGLGSYVDPPAGVTPTLEHVVGPNPALRTTVAVGAETVKGEATMGVSPVLDTLAGVGAARQHPDYAKVVAALKTPLVGAAKGGADRSVVADALLAPRTPGAVPKFVTVDDDVLMPLAEQFAIPKYVAPTPPKLPKGAPTPPKLTVPEKLALVYPSGRFTVQIEGHTLEVVFHP